MVEEYAEIVSSRAVERFLYKYYVSKDLIDGLLIVSPWVSKLTDSSVSLEKACNKAAENDTPLYIFTRKPRELYHEEAVNIFKNYSNIELRYNESLHAKLYVAKFRDSTKSFALLGSANLTQRGLDENIEIAIMIYGRGRGKIIIDELYRWGIINLRTLNESKKIKSMKYRRR